jgi:hypothetical protein
MIENKVLKMLEPKDEVKGEIRILHRGTSWFLQISCNIGGTVKSKRLLREREGLETQKYGGGKVTWETAEMEG